MKTSKSDYMRYKRAQEDADRAMEWGRSIYPNFEAYVPKMRALSMDNTFQINWEDSYKNIIARLYYAASGGIQ